MIRISIILGLVLWMSQTMFGGYKIIGNINLSENWQRQIFLAKVEKLDDYYKADPSHIVSVAVINEDGSFELAGDNLPEEKRYYRLYLIKEENSEFDACLFVGGDDHNFMHVILNNESSIEISADDKYVAPFGNYDIIGDEDNIIMRDLNRLVHPSYYFYQIKFPSELQFSQDKLNRDLISFADSCSNSLAGLAAVINTDMYHNFPQQKSFYFDFGKRLKAEKTNHSYTKDYYRKLRYYDMDNQSSSSNIWPYIAMFFGLTSLILVWNNLKLRQTQNRKNPTTIGNQKNTLTVQEQKILDLIIAGKSNKEIAAELFIGLSTVKTHINKIYAKLGLKDRKEAIKLGSSVH